ncbi:MAG: response regulator [Bacteroidota bacterium]|nr:response regulator [Bacteroidota bacterium]
MAKRILLAEDDEDNRDLVEFVMKRSGLDVELLLAEDGKQAVEIAIKEIPDLILMDMQMPVMDGYQATQAIKANPATKGIPVIAFTAQAKPEDKERTLKIGCVEHYSKPMDPEELLIVVQKYLP